tara:strand:- start:371 stop:964 length:594 start_codon:yes stop_codon:yes gene_type:complete
MKINQNFTQVTLISIGILLILATYFLYPQIKQKKIYTEQTQIEEKEKVELGKEKTNVFENVEYKGFYDLDKSFFVKSEKAVIFEEDSDVVHMKDMHVTLYMDDGRIVIITSDEGRYNKVTYDCFFEKNVKATDGKTVILAENLDLISTEDAAAVYNNVNLNSDSGTLRADKVYYDFQKKYYRISMFDKKKVKIKLIE